jgi:hypothetical protein
MTTLRARGHERHATLEQLERREDEMRGPVGPRPLLGREAARQSAAAAACRRARWPMRRRARGVRPPRPAQSRRRPIRRSRRASARFGNEK